METKNIILELRSQKGWSQDEFAEKVFVTRQRRCAFIEKVLSQTAEKGANARKRHFG